MKITKRSDGRYFTRITKDGIRKSIYGKTQREVESKASLYLYELNAGLNVSDGGITFKELAEKWLNTKQKSKQYNTRKAIEYKLKNHIYPAIGDVKVKNLKPYNVQSVVNSIAEKGFTNTVTKVYQHIHSILQFGVDNEFLAKNVASSVTIPKFKSKEKHALTKEQCKAIEEVAKINKYGDMILVFLYTGMRRQELIALTPKDIDLKANIIHIDKAIFFKNNQACLKATKNGDSRIIPIIRKIRPILERHLSSEYVFPMSNGKMMSETSFSEAIKSFKKSLNEYVKINNIEPFNFTAHQLRHTFCSNLYYAGIQLKEAQQIMGHRSAKVTLDIYTHLSANNHEESINKLDEYLSKF